MWYNSKQSSIVYIKSMSDLAHKAKGSEFPDCCELWKQANCWFRLQKQKHFRLCVRDHAVVISTLWSPSQNPDVLSKHSEHQLRVSTSTKAPVCWPLMHHERITEFTRTYCGCRKRDDWVVPVDQLNVPGQGTDKTGCLCWPQARWDPEREAPRAWRRGR